MRWPGFLVCLVATTASAKPSNPAFLGVGMQDAGGARGAGPCMVTSVTKDSGAHAAGLRSGDLLLGLDGTAVDTCDVLISLIQARDPGDVIKLDVRRGGPVVTIKAQLLSRDEVLRRRFVGQPVPSTHLVRVDDRTVTDLSDPKSRTTTIVGWFDSDCEGCDRVFSRVARWSRTSKGAPVDVIGATAGEKHRSTAENLETLKLAARTLDVPLMLADVETFEDFAIADTDRIHFMVIDSRGVVQFVAPVAPKGDDTDAVLDELFSAAEQATRLR